MKAKMYKSLSIILTFSIVIFYFMTISINIYAYSPDDFINDNHSYWDNMTNTEKWALIYNYTISQLRAVYNGNFESYLKASEAWGDYVGEKNPDDFVDFKDDSFTIPSDFTSMIKQALIDYANEMNEFWIVPTNSWHDLDSTKFSNRNLYNSIRYLTNDAGMAAFNGMSGTITMLAAPMTNYIENGYVFIAQNPSYDINNLYSDVLWVNMYSPDWVIISNGYRQFNINNLEDTYTSFSQGSDPTSAPRMFSKYGLNYVTTSGGSIYNYTSDSSGRSAASVLTSDGCRVRVYKSLNSYKLYSVGQRAVYFGSGFYDAEVGQLEGSFNDLADSIDQLDETLKKLLDQIDDTTEESEIEDLLQQILDEMRNKGNGDDDNKGNGSGGGNSGGSGNYDDSLDDILDILKKINSNVKEVLDGIKELDSSDYLKDISSSLKDILKEIKDFDFSGKDEQDKSILGDLFSLLLKLFDDPETGSQETVDALSSSFGELAAGLAKKFPFSIPWDLYRLFTILAGSSGEAAASIQPYGIAPDDIQPYAGSPRDAPYFELPIVIERYGIDERIIVDMAPFQPISTLSRFLFTVIFCVGLMKFTVKLSEMLKGVFE